MSSEKQIAANRNNGPKSTGPKNTDSTRFNAVKHGLLAVGVTELDDAAGYQNILDGLMKDYEPVGTLEKFFIESMSLYMVRCMRARRLEAEYITGLLNPPLFERDPFAHLDLLDRGAVLDEGLPASILPGTMQSLVGQYQRYETHFSNLLFKTIKQLNQMQRMRRDGERKPTRTTTNVSARHERATPISVPAAPAPAKVSPSDGEGLSGTPAVDSSHAGENGAARTDFEQQDVPAANAENLARPAVNVADIGSLSVNKPPAPWRPPVKSGPIWNK
jgi:hypothetical protein